jgi:hypothetical protein
MGSIYIGNLEKKRSLLDDDIMLDKNLLVYARGKNGEE